MNLIEKKASRFFKSLHNSEHEEFGTSVITYVKPDITSNPLLTAPWNVYEAAVHHEQLLFLVSRESPLTIEITELTQWRVKVFHDLYRQLGLFSDFPDQAVSAAAKSLAFVAKPYAKADKDTLYGATSLIRNLLDDFSEAANAPAVALAPGLTAIVTELERVNNRIHTLLVQRDQAMAQLELLGKRVDVRADVDQALVNVIDAINSAYNVNELGAKDPAVSTPLRNAATTLHGFISHLENILARRGHKHANPSKPQNPDNTLPPAPRSKTQPPGANPPTLNPAHHNPPPVGVRKDPPPDTPARRLFRTLTCPPF
ncbi:MAG: DUF6261 family protein [Tannerellaceae bacterium]|jgi:hypothetical protein|nr:DUF6261 family protein [Tannerellaceae bacterium]